MMLSRKEIEKIIYDVLKKNSYGKDVEVARECADALWDKDVDTEATSAEWLRIWCRDWPLDSKPIRY